MRKVRMMVGRRALRRVGLSMRFFPPLPPLLLPLQPSPCEVGWGGLGGLIQTRASRLVQDDAASVRSTQSEQKRAQSQSQSNTNTPDNNNSLPRSVEALLKFLPDRRAKLGGLLSSLGITPSQSHTYPPLSSTPVDELFALPNAPFANLTPEQLLRCAQVVDTALFKAYLVVRPGLIGALCRRYNWCEVEEVEGVLRGREVRSFFVFLVRVRELGN